MPKKPLILIGGGGHCKSCIDVIEATNNWEIKGILDKNVKIGQLLLNYPVIGSDDEIDELIANNNYFLITIGQIKSAAIRKGIFINLKLKKAKIATIISPKATVSKNASVGAGTIVHHNCIINAGAYIGENNIINTASIVEHDVKIGNDNHISTRVVLNGNVSLGDACFIGSGSIVLNGLRIIDNVVVGAGSLVTKSIEESGVYLGSPSKKIKK